MVRKTPILIIASLVLLATGVAAASNLLVGTSPGLTVSGGLLVVQSSEPSTTTAPSTVGPSTGASATGALGTTAPSTGATETTDGTTTNGTPTAPPTGTLGIDQVVSITRAVAAGTPVAAFTVPAGQHLVITDLLVTNAGTSPACGAAVSPAEAGTPTGSGEAGTGLLCIPAQTSLNLGLTTGLEFVGGQSVVLANASAATEGATTGTTLHYHLRGFLMSTSGT
jgi:hypothetical protein